MLPDTVAGSIYWLVRWFDWYPAILALVELLSLLRPAKNARSLAGLNLITACLGLFWLLLSISELFTTWYSQTEFEQYAFVNRATGPYWWAYWGGVLPLLLSQLLWWPRLRRSFIFSLGLALALLFQPVLERLLVLLLSLHRGYLPSSWVMISPETPLRLALCFGGLGLLLWLRWRRRQSQH